MIIFIHLEGRGENVEDMEEDQEVMQEDNGENMEEDDEDDIEIEL